MNNLTDLKNFLSEFCEISAFNGMFLHTHHGKWGMANDEYYLDGKVVSRKEIKLMTLLNRTLR